MENQPQATEKYKGNGKLTAFLGGATEGSVIGTAGLGIYGGTKMVKLHANSNSLEHYAEQVVEKASSPKNIVIAAIAAIGIPVIAGVLSARRAGKGKKQFEETQHKLVVAEQQVNQLSEAIGVEREQNKRYTDIIASRQQHGTHTAAAEHEKHHAASDEHAR